MLPSALEKKGSNWMPIKVTICSDWERGQVDRVLDLRSEGLRFDSQHWSYVEVSGKLCNPHCLSLSSCNGYLVHKSIVGSIVAGGIGAHLARIKVKSAEHAYVWMSGLPLHSQTPANITLDVLIRH